MPCSKSRIEDAFLQYITNFCDSNNIEYKIQLEWIDAPGRPFFIMFRSPSDTYFYNTTRLSNERVYFKMGDPTIFKKLEKLIIEHWGSM